MNRLGREKSPYLLQHAANPVDWYPWGREAFLKAEKEDKPVFLSIGYSTCHWCHVMAEESFENSALAEVLNRDFICVKVDREERPDIDSAYMNAVQALTGTGGWPLNVFLTPGKLPFYGGTYFPPDQLKAVLLAVSGAWKTERDKIDRSAARIAAALNARPAAPEEKKAVSKEVFDKAFRTLASQYDPAFGGFGRAPKFPTGHALSFLLLRYYRTGDKRALEMVENTIGHLADGGIFDRLGGGVHRYSTDREWFLPHFEKMLYDQALLANACLEAYQLTGKEEYAALARKIFDYVLRDMTHGEGGFYSAEDADSAPDPARPREKTEGAYYVWTKEEVLSVLGEEAGGLACFRYGIRTEGNVGADPRREFVKKNVLSAANTLKAAAGRFKIPEEEAEKVLGRSLEKLFLARSRRPRPHLDDKILTDWNGLMISSLAKGGGILGEPRYSAAAKKAADLLLEKLKTKDGTLLHRFRDGAAGIPGFLADYAFFINGLLDLYEAVFETPYLEQAVELCRKMLELFEDREEGGFFLTAVNSETILARRAKEYYDGAVPSGNSLAALALARLYGITRREEFEKPLKALLDHVSAVLAAAPAAYTQLLTAADAALEPAGQIAIAAADDKDPFAAKAASLVRGRFLPGRVLLRRAARKKDGLLTISPWIKGLGAAGGKTTVYVCVNRTCLPPATELAELEKLLRPPP